MRRNPCSKLYKIILFGVCQWKDALEKLQNIYETSVNKYQAWLYVTLPAWSQLKTLPRAEFNFGTLVRRFNYWAIASKNWRQAFSSPNAWIGGTKCFFSFFSMVPKITLESHAKIFWHEDVWKILKMEFIGLLWAKVK